MNEAGLQEIKVASKNEMQQGIACLGRGEWRTAVGHFERAVTLRERLPWREDPESAWVLAAAWMNRSDAIRHLADPALLPEAVLSLDNAIAAMRHVPLGGNPMHAERLILAWINRGTLCGDAGETEAALASFARAGELFLSQGVDTTVERGLMHSMLHVNRGRMLLDAGRLEEGRRDAAEGVRILKPLEPGEGLVPEAALRARALLCRALALRLDEPGGREESGDWIAEATDTVEEALAIVKRTGLSGDWIADLVRYGARIYRICQPQFLGEFVSEWLAPDSPLGADAELRGEMEKVMLLARAEAEERLLLAPHDDAHVQRELRILRSLGVGPAGAS